MNPEPQKRGCRECKEVYYHLHTCSLNKWPGARRPVEDSEREQSERVAEAAARQPAPSIDAGLTLRDLENMMRQLGDMSMLVCSHGSWDLFAPIRETITIPIPNHRMAGNGKTIADSIARARDWKEKHGQSS